MKICTAFVYIMGIVHTGFCFASESESITKRRDMLIKHIDLFYHVQHTAAYENLFTLFMTEPVEVIDNKQVSPFYKLVYDRIAYHGQQKLSDTGKMLSSALIDQVLSQFNKPINVDRASNGPSLLQHAILQEDYDTVHLLCTHKANVNQTILSNDPRFSFYYISPYQMLLTKIVNTIKESKTGDDRCLVQKNFAACFNAFLAHGAVVNNHIVSPDGVSRLPFTCFIHYNCFFLASCMLFLRDDVRILDASCNEIIEKIEENQWSYNEVIDMKSLITLLEHYDGAASGRKNSVRSRIDFEQAHKIVDNRLLYMRKE